MLFGRPEHPFFASAPLAVAWEICGSSLSGALPSQPLARLAANRDLLPGAVFFTVPPGKEDDPEWAPLIEASQPHCLCPSRRIMYPLRGRTRLLLRRPKSRQVTITFDESYSKSHFYDSKVLALTPYGGDVASAYAGLVVRNDGLMVETRPFMAHKLPGKKQVWTQRDGVADLAASAWYAERVVLEEVLQLHGEIPFMQTVPRPDMDAHGTLPLCSLVGVSGGKDGRPLRFTIEVDVTIGVVTGLDEAEPEHECRAAQA